MEYLRHQGYPVPAVEELSADGGDLVMERIDGASMVEAVGRSPWAVRRQGGILADLHRRLHDVPSPDFLGPAPVGRGDRVLHLDLHPLNVLMGPKGPVVIDWANACLGDPGVDVALAWVLMSAGEIPGGRIEPGCWAGDGACSSTALSVISTRSSSPDSFAKWSSGRSRTLT